MGGNLIGELNMYKENGIKPNFTDLANRYGLDRHTVAKYWNGGGASPEDGRSRRGSGFDRYRDEIEEKAAIPGVTAKGIHELLLDRHAGDEPPVPGYNAFTSYLRTHGIRPGERPPQAHPRFETPPGLQLQFDWKEDLLMHDRSGAEYRFNVYTSALGYSRRHFYARSLTRTRDDLLRCMADNIWFLGGVPSQWVTDNMSAVATFGPSGRRSRDPRVQAFARAAGFELVLCRARTPETKGKDESANRFVNRLLAYEGDFDGWEGIDAAIARIQLRSNEEPNATTGAPPELLFLREKDALGPAPSRRELEALLGEVSHQTVPATQLVRCAGREWSVPRRCIGRRVRLLLLPGGELRVYDRGALVAVHDTSAPGGRVSYRPADYEEALEGKSWGGMDEDIEEAARRNLELLGGVGGAS